MYMCLKAVPMHTCTQRPCYFCVNTHDHKYSDQFFMMMSSKKCLYLMSVQFVRISVVPHPLTYWSYLPVMTTYTTNIYIVCRMWPLFDDAIGGVCIGLFLFVLILQLL